MRRVYVDEKLEAPHLWPDVVIQDRNGTEVHQAQPTIELAHRLAAAVRRDLLSLR